nr:hypothetical protein [Streptococcus mitis]
MNGRSAIECIIGQYQVKTDKKSGITMIQMTIVRMRNISSIYY